MGKRPKEPKESPTTEKARRIVEGFDADRLRKEIEKRPPCECGGVRLEVTEGIFDCMSCGKVW